MSHQLVLGGVYIAKFPYLDSSEDKVRPVIVVGEPYGRYGIIAVVPVFSKLSMESVDFSVNDWQDAGLLKPSIARVHRLTTLLLMDLGTQLGTLNTVDHEQLKKSLRSFLNL